METKNLDIYGSAPLEWARALRQLENRESKSTTWLATTSPSGRPHVAGVGALWLDGKFYVVSGPGTRKSRNLEANPNCSLAVSLNDLDLVIEGRAAKVTDPEKLARIAAAYAAQGWPAEAQGGALVAPYSAPSAGPPPWDLYEVTPESAIGVATEEPHGATRWRLT